MSAKSKIKAGVGAAKMALAVACNSGVISEGYKSMVLIEPSSVCNLSCPLCPTGTRSLKRENKFIPMKTFDRIIELTSPHAQGFILNMFGEPTFHPQFQELLEKTRPFPTWLSTNLSYDEKAARLLAGFDHLHVICSVDTVNPEEYTEYRIGGNYERVMENLGILAAGKCKVYPQFLVPREKYDEEEFLAFAKRHGIPLENMIIKEKLEHYRLDPTESPRPGVCHSFYTGIYFTCDGYLVPCCNNVREELFIKHVDEISTMEDIFSGPEARRIRKALARDKNQFASCGRCAGYSYWKHDFKGNLAAILRVLSLRGKQDAKMQWMDF